MDLNVYKQNILNWYPFKKEDTILEIGANEGELTQIFINNCKEVIAIETNPLKAEKIIEKFQKNKNLKVMKTSVEQFQSDKKFDYITLIGIVERLEELVGNNLKLAKIIKKLEQFLKPQGKILIAVDNKFGLKFFAGDTEKVLDKKFVSLNGYNNESKKIETFTKSRLERILGEMGYKTNFYYPLPDYKLPAVIFSDKHLPNYTSIDKYNPYHTEKSTILINEIDVFREILKNNEEMFTFFANSFLVEASKENFESEFKYVSFNNLRKQKYQLITKISESYVEKQIVNKKAEEHYENIKTNINILKQNEIDTVDYVEENKIKSKYIDQKYLLNNVLAEKLENGKLEEFNNILDKYIQIISKNSYKETDYQKTIFGNYNIDTEDESIIEELHFLPNGLWDMTFKNCFYVDNKFLFFDQEWNKPNLPYEYILYRSILYTISLRRFLSIEDLYKKYNLTNYLELFKKLDDRLQEEIRDDEVWKFYSQDKFIDIDGTKQEIINVNIRNEAMQGAIDNLKKENEKIKSEYENYRHNIESKTSYKIYKKLKRLTKLSGGKNE